MLRRAQVLVGLTTLETVALPLTACDSSPAVGHAYHVDCAGGPGGDGSTSHPFADLAAVGSLVVGPGDQILLRRGTVCAGTLTIKGGGS